MRTCSAVNFFVCRTCEKSRTDGSSEDTVDRDTPKTTAALDARDADVHQLVLVDPDGDEERGGREYDDERRERCVDEADGQEEEVVGDVDGIVELGRLGPLADLARRATEEARPDPDGQEREELGKIKDRRGSAEREDGQPVVALDDPGLLELVWDCLEVVEDSRGRLVALNLLHDLHHCIKLVSWLALRAKERK